MVGNDIIDLSLVLNKNNSKNLRYLKKLFSFSEIEFIQNSRKPEVMLWIFWSMKESVYKSHQRRTRHSRRFNPTSYLCDFNCADNSGSVCIDTIQYPTYTKLNTKYLHTISIKEGNDYFSEVADSDQLPKNLIISKISEKISVESESLSLEKDLLGIPRIKEKRTQRQIPVSFSHHGDFTAFVVPLIKS